jgi:hypothetical protein
MLNRVARELDLRSLTIVVDDPDLGRQAFRAGPGPFGAGALTGEPGCRADPPLSSDRVDAELLVALCAASLRVDVLRGDAANDVDAAEIALRRLPGILSVTVERDEELLVVQIHAAADAPDDLGRVAARATASLAEGSVVVEILRSSDSLLGPGITAPVAVEQPVPPTLVAVRSIPEAGEIEAHVRLGSARTIGRAQMAQGLAGAVDAVLDALRQHIPDLDLSLAWARTIETTPDRRFVVAVALHEGETRTTRHGLGSGASPIEGAARAAVDAAFRSDELPADPA